MLLVYFQNTESPVEERNIYCPSREVNLRISVDLSMALQIEKKNEVNRHTCKRYPTVRIPCLSNVTSGSSIYLITSKALYVYSVAEPKYKNISV